MKHTMFSLEGKHALVTGSTRGIGRAIRLALSEAGAKVVAHGLEDGDAGREMLAESRNLKGDVSYIPGDLGVAGGGRRLAEDVLKQAGPVDIIVLNASMQIRRPWSEISAEEGDLQMQTNFHASREILQVLTPLMQEKGWGRILTIGSVQQIKPHPDMLIYAASKAAQMSLVRSLARQLAPSGITVNNLAPGVILTDRNLSALADASYAERVRASIPCDFFGEPQDCAGAALLLCSEAGRYITGQNLYVDGGMSLS